jgi:hypothetical protein
VLSFFFRTVTCSHSLLHLLLLDFDSPYYPFRESYRQGWIHSVELSASDRM